MSQETHQTDTRVPDDDWTDDDALSDDDPFVDEDQRDDERPARPRRRIPPLATGLLAVVIAGLGFIGGVQVQKHADGESGDGMPAAMMQAGPPGGAGGSGARSGAGVTAGGTSSSTTGEVANVKGSRLYVTAADGSTVEVSVGKKATVQRLAEADADEIRPGDSVVVTGTTADDGSVKATAVQATASGVSLLGGFGGRGGGTSSPGTGAAASGAAGGAGSGGRSGADAPSDDSAAVDQLFESGD